MTLEIDIGFLKTIGMFQNVDPSRLKLIALMSERVQYAANDRFFRQGQKTDAVFFILAGEVEIYRNSPQARIHALSMEKGTFFGAAALLTGATYPGDIIAKTDGVALRISKELFFELMQSVPEFSLAVARDLVARIYNITNRIFEVEEAS